MPFRSKTLLRVILLLLLLLLALLFLLLSLPPTLLSLAALLLWLLTRFVVILSYSFELGVKVKVFMGRELALARDVQDFFLAETE